MLTHRFSSISAKEWLSKADTLAVIPLSEKCKPDEPGFIYAGLKEADGRSLNEVWTSSGNVTRGQSGETHWSKTSDVICVAHWLSDEDCKEIENATKKAYMSMLSVLKEQGYPHPFRFWNYLPAINQGEGDQEVYKQFCTGRLSAFESSGITPSAFPAASALGHHSEGAVFYVMASTAAPLHFRNKKQINAYDYPRQYGISSPSFARATALNLQQSPYLFISGTASIVGHKTIEAGNLEGQLEVTMGNIRHLLTTANPDKRSLSTFKVYVRHHHHVARTKTWLAERFPEVDTVITIADVCRSDLLVEIECFCQ